MTNIIIRPAKESNAERIFEIHRDAILNIEDYLYSQDLKQAWAPENSKRAEKIIISEQYYTVVAIIDKKVVGFGSVTENNLKLLYVDPNFQQQGVATKILQHLEERIPKPIELKVSKNAVEFYHKHGYKIRSKATVMFKNKAIDTFLAWKS